MFSKTIELVASKQEFRFVAGTREIRFRPIVFLSSDNRICAIGEAEAGGPASRGIDVFADPKADAIALLESLFRYGMRSVLGRFTLGPVVVKITIAADIRADLKGFTDSIFRHAATQAGASKVTL